MRKGFTRRPKVEEPVSDHGTNYITPGGIERLKEERHFLLTKDRPAVVEVVAWAAGNGDRSENADYQYSKRRLRQIDGRVRFLTKRIEAMEVVDPEAPRTGQRATRTFFGATVRYVNASGIERVVSIVGTDEVNLDRNHISWASNVRAVSLKGGCLSRHLDSLVCPARNKFGIDAQPVRTGERSRTCTSTRGSQCMKSFCKEGGGSMLNSSSPMCFACGVRFRVVYSLMIREKRPTNCGCTLRQSFCKRTWSYLN